MAFALYSNYVVRMRSELPMCPDPIIMQEMQKASLEFFRNSGVWLSTLAAMNIVANQASYTLTLPAMSQLQQIQWVKCNFSPAVTPFDTVYAMAPGSYYLSDDQTSLVFYTYAIPTQNVTGGLQVQLMLVPTWDATGVPTCFLNRYAEGIMARTKYNLMTMAKKPWSDAQNAGRYLARYNAELAEATRDKGSQNLNAATVFAIPEL